MSLSLLWACWRRVVARCLVMSSEAGTSARQAVRWAVVGLSGVRTGPQKPLAELGSVVTARASLDRAVGLYVQAARLEGSSWADIGDALGVSRQAARERFGKLVARPTDNWREIELDDMVMVSGELLLRVALDSRR